MKARTKKIVEILKETYPDAKCELNYETPLQLLVATVLSAQTTDKKVNEGKDKENCRNFKRNLSRRKM